MVIGVVILQRGLPAGDDAPCATVAQPRGFHGVFAIIAAWLLGQPALPVPKYAVILTMRVGTAACDQGQRVVRFSRQESGQSLRSGFVDLRDGRSSGHRWSSHWRYRFIPLRLQPPHGQQHQHEHEQWRKLAYAGRR